VLAESSLIICNRCNCYRRD